VGCQLDLACLPDQPPHPADRRDQLGDGVLGGDRVGQDGGIQHPPTPTGEHPGLLHHLADRLEDPPRPIRGPRTSPPVHQHRGVESLVVQPQPAGDLPGNITPQRTDRLAVRQALQGLQHHHRGDHLGGHRRMPATLADNISEQLGRKQLVTMASEEGVHRPVRDQVATPARRVQLVIGWLGLGTHTRSLSADSLQRELPDRRSQQDRPNRRDQQTSAGS